MKLVRSHLSIKLVSKVVSNSFISEYFSQITTYFKYLLHADLV